MKNTLQYSLNIVEFYIMAGFMKKIIIVISNLLVFNAVINSQNISNIDKITIKSIKAGWSYAQSELIIDVYNNQFGINKKIASPDYSAKILQFISMIEEHEIKAIGLDNFGINQDWLNTNVIIWLGKKESWDNEQKIFFTKIFTNIETIKKILQNEYIPDRDHWTDDYPNFEINIIYKNGSIKQIKSNSQLPFMLPWEIIISGDIKKTYNAQISRAISSILSGNFTNKDRIAGGGLLNFIAERVERQIHDELAMIKTRNTIGMAMQNIENKFIIKKSSFRDISSNDLDTESVWDTELILKTGPQNLIIGLDIAYNNQKLGNLEPFLVQISSIIDRVKNTAWIGKILANHQNSVEIRFVHNKSMSNKAQKSFIKDMEEHGKTDLIEEIKDKLNNSIYLIIQEPNNRYSRCILLPNGKTILWHFKGNTVLFWNANQFQTWEWYGHRSTGAVILQDGTIEKK